MVHLFPGQLLRQAIHQRDDTLLIQGDHSQSDAPLLDPLRNERALRDDDGGLKIDGLLQFVGLRIPHILIGGVIGGKHPVNLGINGRQVTWALI